MQNTNGGKRTGKSKKQKQQGQKQRQGSTATRRGADVPKMPLQRAVGEPGFSTSFIDYFDVNCNGAGVVGASYNLAVVSNTGDSISPITNVMQRLATVAQAYRQFKINWAKFTFYSLVGSGQAGYMCLGVDAVPSANIPSAQNQVIRHSCSAMGDIKDDYTIVYRPSQDGKTTAKYTYTTTPAFSPDELSYGSFQVYGVASGVTAVTLVGKIRMELHVSLMSPT